MSFYASGKENSEIQIYSFEAIYDGFMNRGWDGRGKKRWGMRGERRRDLPQTESDKPTGRQSERLLDAWASNRRWRQRKQSEDKVA